MFPGMLGMEYGGLLNPQDQAYLRNQGMMNLIGNLLANSGPSPVKQNFGSIAGKGLLGMQQGQQQAMQGLLQSRLIQSKLEKAERDKKREDVLPGLVGQVGSPAIQRDIPLRDIPEVQGTGLLGGKIDEKRFYASLAGLGGDYTKLGITGLKSLNPSASESPSAVREYEFFKKLGPAEQRQFLEIKRAFQPFSYVDYQGGKSAFDKRVGTVAPLSTAQQEAAGQGTVAEGKEFGKISGEVGANTNIKKPAMARETLVLLDEADKLIDQSTGSVGGTVVDKGLGAVGLSTKGAQAAAELKVIQASLMTNMPRMEGPQSDKDVQLYREAAGQVGDSMVPNGVKKSAIAQIRRINEKYAARVSPKKRIRVDAQGNVIGD